MWDTWKSQRDRDSMHFGQIVASVYNIVSGKDSKILQWTDFYKPLHPAIAEAARKAEEHASFPTDYEALKAQWKANPELARRHSQAAKESGAAILERFSSAE